MPDIRIHVSVHYAEQHSSSERHVFVYFIRIENHAEETYQLMRREWFITDGNGTTTHVEGEGVIGEQPILPPGGQFTYNSFTHVTTMPGEMRGTYIFRDAWGEEYRVPIPAFTLARSEPRTLN